MNEAELAERAERFARALFAFEDALDWAALGALYSEGEGATSFFDDERRDALRETGLLVADDVAALLSRAVAAGAGAASAGPAASVYFGGSVAELAPWLSEVLVLGRRAWLVNRGAEARLLEDARARVASGLDLDLPPVLEGDLELPARLTHVWLVSVLTDPDAFPALHDELYERPGEADANGAAYLVDERARAEALLRRLLTRAAPGALFSTTDEELVLARPVAASLGLDVEVPSSGRLTAVVGDRLRHCRLIPREGEA